MADQKINELPTKTAPSTGDKMLMIGTAEEYQIDYDQLATAILNKLSTQSFSSLDTTSKTVLGAIDELNSKSYLLQGGTSIPSSSDMDEYRDVGNYICTSYSIANTLINSPFNRAFLLKVGKTGSSVAYQIYKEVESGKCAYRYYTGSSWLDYTYFSDDATIFAGTAIQSGDDLNDYTKPGRYYSPNASTTASLLNMPEIFESGFSMDVLPISSNNVQIIYPGGAGKNIYTRSAVSSGWQPWYKFAGTVISS